MFAVPGSLDNILELPTSIEVNESIEDALVARTLNNMTSKCFVNSPIQVLSERSNISNAVQVILEQTKKILVISNKSISVEDPLIVVNFNNLVQTMENIDSRRANLLERVKNLCSHLNVTIEYGFSCEASLLLLSHIIEPRWMAFSSLLENWEVTKTQVTIQDLASSYPFSDLQTFKTIKQLQIVVKDEYNAIVELFEELSRYRPLELLHSAERKLRFLLSFETTVAIAEPKAFLENMSLLNRYQYTVVLADNAHILDTAVLLSTLKATVDSLILAGNSVYPSLFKDL